MPISVNQFTQKLQHYLAKVEKETGRPIIIEKGEGVLPPTGTAGWQPHPTDITIFVNLARLQGENLERAIAHEATHGLFAYARNHCQIFPMLNIDPMQDLSTSWLGSMIEDIAVNTLIQANGYMPYDSNYLEMVRRQTEAFRLRRDAYSQYDEPYKSRYMVNRYVYGWAFLNYFKIAPAARKILQEFMAEFERVRPVQFRLAHQVTKAIAAHDVLTAEGSCKAMWDVARLWDLDQLVRIEPFS